MAFEVFDPTMNRLPKVELLQIIGALKEKPECYAHWDAIPRVAKATRRSLGMYHVLKMNADSKSHGTIVRLRQGKYDRGC